jgi:hypothetical protein
MKRIFKRSKIDKPLARLTKKMEKGPNKIEDENGGVINDAIKTLKIIKDYYE